MVDDVDLVKVQIYADRCSTKFSISSAYAITALIGYAVFVFTVGFTIEIHLIALLLFLFGPTVIGFRYWFKCRDNYNREKIQVSEMLDFIKQGNTLPSLKELYKWDKNKQE